MQGAIDAWRVVVVWGVVLTEVSLTLVGTASDAQGLIAKYRGATTIWDKHACMRIHTETESQDLSDMTARYCQIDQIHRRDRDRADWVGTRRIMKGGKDETSPVSVEEEVIVLNGSDFVVANREAASGDPYFGGVTRRLYAEGMRSTLQDYYNGGFLNGLMPLDGETYVADFLSKSETARSVGEESIDGVVCHVVEAAEALFTVRVWIAPSKGYNALKIVVTGASQAWSVVIDSIEFQEIDGNFIPVSGRFTKINQKSKSKVVVHAKRTEIDLNPDFEALGAFSLRSLPDGTRIIDRDHKGISYSVLSGRLVPYVNDLVVDAIESQLESETASSLAPQDTDRVQVLEKTTAAAQPGGDRPDTNNLTNPQSAVANSILLWGTIFGAGALFTGAGVIIVRYAGKGQNQ